jgi:signal peptidase
LRRASAVAWAAFVIAVVTVVAALHVALGLDVVVVDGNSMLPTLQTGDLVLIAKENPTAISVGDVIVYTYTGFFYGVYLSNAYIIHRVIYIYYNNGVLCFVTKGDNNPLPDPGFPQYCGYVSINGTNVSGVPYWKVVGVVVGGRTPIAIPFIGSLSIALRPPSGPT